MQEERREELEAELRVLHSQLDTSSSACGDWNMCRALEGLIELMKTATEENFIAKFMGWFADSGESLQAIINQRITTRNRIQEIEEELGE